MNEYKEAIEVLQGIKSSYFDLQSDCPEEAHSIDLAIETLEKQAFFENNISNISDWFVDNRDSLLDTALTVSTKSFNQYNENGKIDEVDLEFIVSDIVDEIQKGILNVLSTYENN